MNQIDNKLPEIINEACHFAMLEYEINQILKEFDCKTEVNNEKDKTVEYIYDKLNIIHNQVKLIKAKQTQLKLEAVYAEKKSEMYLREIHILENYLEKHNESDGDRYEEDNDEDDYSSIREKYNYNENNINPILLPINDKQNIEISTERKSQIIKQKNNNEDDFC